MTLQMPKGTPWNQCSLLNWNAVPNLEQNMNVISLPDARHIRRVAKIIGLQSKSMVNRWTKLVESSFQVLRT